MKGSQSLGTITRSTIDKRDSENQHKAMLMSQIKTAKPKDMRQRMGFNSQGLKLQLEELNEEYEKSNAKRYQLEESGF